MPRLGGRAAPEADGAAGAARAVPRDEARGLEQPGVAAAVVLLPQQGESAPLLYEEGPASERWSRPRLCACVACVACAVAAAAVAVLVFGVGVDAASGVSAPRARELRGVGPWLIFSVGPWATTTTTTTTTTECPGAAQRRLFRIVKNPDGTVSVRASNGGYIGVTEEGQLSNEAAIGERECFKLLKHDDGTISLRARTGSYIGAKDGKMRVRSKIGSAEKLSMFEKEDGAIMLEDSDGWYVSSDPISDGPGRFAVRTRKATGADDAEKFYVEANSDGTISLVSFHGTYLSVEDSASVVAGSLKVGKEQKFKRHQNSDGTTSLFAVHAGRYLAAHANGTVLARGKKVYKQEKFQLVERNGTFDGTYFSASKVPYSFRAFDGTYLSVSKVPIFTFYMYRSQGNDDYPWRSVNTGNLAGVMWYLHNEVVCAKPRKFGIERIVRMKVQTTSTKALYERGLNFGVRFAYDGGQCTGAGPINGYGSCSGLYARLGHFVGCNYLGDYPFPMAAKGSTIGYDGGVWYSLPKEGACEGVPTGEDNCTYSTEEAGSIFIGDLYDMGRDNYENWYGQWWSREYVEESDNGVGNDFWRAKADNESNRERVKRALELFDEKYPDMPLVEDYTDPVCDFNCKRFYTDDELQEVGAECQCSESPNARNFFGEVNWDQCGFDPRSGMKDAGYYRWLQSKPAVADVR